MDLKLDGRVALVTGSSKGLGEGVARGLAREGAIVIVHGRDKIKTEEVAHDIIAQGGRAYAVMGDLTKEDEVQRLVDEAQAFVKPVEWSIMRAALARRRTGPRHAPRRGRPSTIETSSRPSGSLPACCQACRR
jgi:NAD(P)-dependent dehydrogenase (short-subunit alcohol dehydrogenase family)